MVVCLDTLPGSLSTSGGWGASYWYPAAYTNWVSGQQWLGGSPWVRCGGGPMLSMGMGNPLQPGTYYVGVQDPSNTNSYTLQSRGIGRGYSIPVQTLDFNGSVSNGSLNAGQGDYYQVVVPSNEPDWKLQLHALGGDVLLMAQENYLPNSQAMAPDGGYYYGAYWTYGGVVAGQGGQEMMKAGDEQWVLMPQNMGGVIDGTNVAAGTYYVLVGSQGQNLTNNCGPAGTGLGGGSASYSLSSGIEAVTVLSNTLSYGNDLLFRTRRRVGR